MIQTYAGEWHPAIEAVGPVKVGGLVMNPFIYDSLKKMSASLLFINAMGYWENLLRANNFIKADAVLPQKIIPAKHTASPPPLGSSPDTAGP